MKGNIARLRFIINSQVERRHGNIEAIIRDVLDGTGVAYDIVRTERRGHGTALALQAAEEGIDLVVAAGGDGTLNEVGSALLGRKTILGLLPCGSGNGFARAMGIPLDLRRACTGLLRPEIRLLDVGKIGEAAFFSTAGVGLDAEVSRRYAGLPRGRYGFFTFAYLAFDIFRKYKPADVLVVLEDRRNIRAHPLILTVANTSQYGYGAMIAPGARPDDGLLDLCIVENTDILRLLWHARRLFNGTIHQMPGVQLFQGRTMRIVRSDPGLFHVDGEPKTGDATLEVTVVPEGIRMALPPGARGG